jgi:putative membrane protein
MITTYGFWGLVIAVLVLLIRRLVHTGKAGSSGSIERYPAIEILKQRYAKGEITQEEFLGIRGGLR